MSDDITLGADDPATHTRSSRVEPAIISICVCTFKRPRLLADLLAALAALDWPHDCSHIEIVVADNDAAGSAAAVLSQWTPPQNMSLQALQVSEANIALARNATVAAARGDLLAFIDDDERPDPAWLASLVACRRRFDADVVFGPVLARFRAETPSWIRLGGGFDRRRWSTGTVVNEADARTGNALVQAAWLKDRPGPFDVSFGRTGGEDSLLFRGLLARGARFVWCDEAVVSEEVPLERARLGWMLKRSYRVGQTWIRAELHLLAPWPRKRHATYLCFKAGAQLVVCALLALSWLGFSKAKALYWSRKTGEQLGKITGLSPFQYREYGH